MIWLRELFRQARSRLSLQIILPYLAVTLLIALVGSLVGVAFIARTTEERVQSLLAQIARNTSDELVRRERNHLDFLLVVASAPATQDRPSVPDAFVSGDSTQVQRVLAPYYGLAVTNIGLGIDRMVAFDRTGKTYVDWLRVGEDPEMPPQLVTGTDFSGLPVVQQIVSGTLVNGNDKFSNLLYFQPDPQPYFYTVAPVKEGTRVVGGVMIAIKVDRLLTSLQKSNQAGITSLYDLAGQPIGTTLLSRDELASLQMPAAAVQSLASGEAQSLYTVGVRQRDFRFFYSPLFIASQQAGYFSVGYSADLQLQSLNVSRNVVIAIAVMLGLATFVVGAWIARRITVPVFNLVDAAAAVTAGDLNRRSTVNSKDEIGQLARAFNLMTDHLSRLYTASRDLNATIKVDQVLEVTSRTMRALVPDTEVLALIEENGVLRYRISPAADPATHVLEVQPVAAHDPLLQELVAQQVGKTITVAQEPRLAGIGLDSVGYRSLLITPLMAQDRASGLLIAGSRSTDAFAGAAEPTLVAIANMAVSVFNNAVLFDRVQDEAGRRRAILESIADAVVVCDRQHNIILANPAAERMLGMRDWVTQKANFEDVPLVRIEPTQELFGNGLDPEHYRLNDRIVRLSRAPVVADRGANIGEVIVLHDISNEVALDMAKTNFIATISHELRSPLTVILGYTDLLLRGLVGELSAEQRELLEAVRGRVGLMVNIIKNVIIVAEIEAGTLRTDLEPQELWMAVDEAVGMARSSFAKKGLELNVDVPRDLPPVLADREQLQIIINQLIDNGRRYTSTGGVTVRAERIEGNIQVNVIDTGPGISTEQQVLLFTRFHRVEGNSSPERGSGLGLVITRQLVERQGGRVWATSQIGSGSTFVFSLPIAHEHSNALIDQDKPGAATGS
jgi:PAS domain S-box-containing protein